MKVELPCEQKQSAQLSFWTPNSTNGLPEHSNSEKTKTPLIGKRKMSTTTTKPTVVKKMKNIQISTGVFSKNNDLTKPSTANDGTKSTNGMAALNLLNQSLMDFDPLINTSGTVLEAQRDKTIMILQVFSCNDCSETFTTERDLTTHSRTHNKSQPFKCGKLFLLLTSFM